MIELYIHVSPSYNDYIYMVISTSYMFDHNCNNYTNYAMLTIVLYEKADTCTCIPMGVINRVTISPIILSVCFNYYAIPSQAIPGPLIYCRSHLLTLP